MILFLLFLLTAQAQQYYDVLGLKKDATARDIRKAYRKLSVKYHPDKKTGDLKKFEAINEAYNVLSDPDQRENYDNPKYYFEYFRHPFYDFKKKR